MDDITRMLVDLRQGVPGASDRLFARVYGELGKLARAKLAGHQELTLLDPQALLNEACLRLSQYQALPTEGRRLFFAYASNVMRTVIVDYVRQRRSAKRGSGAAHITLVTLPAPPGQEPDVEALDQALDDLQRADERCRQVVEMRYFGGLSIKEIAEVMELSPATVKRDWLKARAFLFKMLRDPAFAA